MRKMVVGAIVSGLMVFGGSPAFADDPSQPDQGAVSSGRNENAVAGGPHCHTVVAGSENQDNFEFISAYPSHTAHIQTGLPAGVFAGDGDCDGDPG